MLVLLPEFKAAGVHDDKIVVRVMLCYTFAKRIQTTFQENLFFSLVIESLFLYQELNFKTFYLIGYFIGKFIDFYLQPRVFIV